MWIFGYGSLMWDGWEKSFNSINCEIANLYKYKRVLNKASIVNWGSREHPCPTLNIVPNIDGICIGTAFEFHEDDKNNVLTYLQKREGTNFELTELDIEITEETRVTAFVPLYKGNHLVSIMLEREIAKHIQMASGKDGYCVDYIKQLVNKFEELGIEDETISNIWNVVQNLL